MLAVRRGFIPDFNAASSGNPQDDAAREAKVQKAGGERFLLLPPNNESQLIPGDYHVAVISEGTNPPGSTVIGTGNVSGQLVSNGPLPVSQLGTAGLTPLSQPVALAGAQVKA